MKITKYLILIFALYFLANLAFWAYQEFISYDNMQIARSLGNEINISRVTIEEKGQYLSSESDNIANQKENVDRLLSEKKIAEYNEAVIPYNKAVESLNKSTQEYYNLISEHNKTVRETNEILLKSGIRKFIFPIPNYVPELYVELQ